MPILVQASNADLLGGLALQAGRAQGYAQVAQQLRAIGANHDAAILEAKIRDQQAKAMEGQEPTTPGGTQGPVQTFTSEPTAQAAQLYGTGAERRSRESAAQLFDRKAEREADPDRKAASKILAERARRGLPIDDQLMKMAGFEGPSDVARETALHQQAERDRVKAEADAQRIGQKAALANKPKFASAHEANAHDIAWNAPAPVVAQALKIAAAAPEVDPLTGQQDKNYEAAVSVRRMLNSEFRGKSTGEIMQRLGELRAAGAPAESLLEAYQYVVQVWHKAEQVRAAVAKLATDAAAHVGDGKLDQQGAARHRAEFRAKALQEAGISEQDYNDYLTAEEQRAGLRPIQ